MESNQRRQSQTVDTAFRLAALFDAFGLCANNGENCRGVLDKTFIPHPDADPYDVLLIKMMEKQQSLRDKGPIYCIPCPKENAEAWQGQKGMTCVLLGVPTNAHHKCYSFDPTLNEIDCTMRAVTLEFAFTPKK